MSISKFIMVSIGILALLLAAAYLLRDALLPPGSLPWVVGAMSLSAVSGMVAYAIVYNGLETKITMFTAYITGSMLLKMMIGIMGVTLVALKFKEFATPFVLSYFFCYFIFTSLEVYWLMRKLRPISKNRVRETQDEEQNT
jgi:predicted membrane-bound mannosyltransferase